MCDNAGWVPMIEKWLMVCGLSLDEYFKILGDGGSSDGLEVWVTSLALDKAVNFVMEDSVWWTSVTGVDFKYPTFLLASYDELIPCAQQEDDLEEQGACVPARPDAVPVLSRNKGGADL